MGGVSNFHLILALKKPCSYYPLLQTQPADHSQLAQLQKEGARHGASLGEAHYLAVGSTTGAAHLVQEGGWEKL